MRDQDFDYDDSRPGNGTSWFVGIVVALALFAIGYLVFSANSAPCAGEVCAMNIEASE